MVDLKLRLSRGKTRKSQPVRDINGKEKRKADLLLPGRSRFLQCFATGRIVGHVKEKIMPARAILVALMLSASAQPLPAARSRKSAPKISRHCHHLWVKW
jgi:hypothetical protein